MVSKKLVLHFSKEITNQPIIYNLVKEHNLVFNLLKAQVSPNEEGILVMELSGKEEDYDKGINYLKDLGVKIQPLSEDVVRDENICTNCSVCIAICPTKALDIKDRKSMKVEFDNSKCIVCNACIEACPVNAMSVKF